ncbi:hypothetical protein KI387_024691, partial [Taxus chinensis]
ADDVIVTFVMVQHAEFGQVFKIIGNGTVLGDWSPANVENMTWTPGDAWASSATLTKGVNYEYKAVVVDFSDGSNAVCYMPDNNRVLTVPESYSKSHYVETVFWKASCGYDCHSTTACGVTSKWTVFDPIRRV